MNMTPELKKLLLDNATAQVAFANQEEREYEFKMPNGEWHRTDSVLYPNKNNPAPVWHRIKPAPKLRPWRSVDEFPLDAWYRRRGTQNPNHHRITSFTDDAVFVGGAWELFGELCEHWEHSTDGCNTWLPCGVEVEG